MDLTYIDLNNGMQKKHALFSYGKSGSPTDPDQVVQTELDAGRWILEELANAMRLSLLLPESALNSS